MLRKGERQEKGEGGPLGGRISCRIQSASVEDEDDLPGCLARGQPRCNEKQRRQHPHNQCGSKMAAGDKIHACIASKDADDNETAKINKLASCMAQLLIEPYYPSVAVDRPERSTMRTGSQAHPVAAPVSRPQCLAGRILERGDGRR
uniref:Uncharacterized protein n=2 Tax=Aegilops tauschii subsp. strangulata TaxID=200361 RepID=A0A453ETY3_AEGTS